MRSVYKAKVRRLRRLVEKAGIVHDDDPHDIDRKLEELDDYETDELYDVVSYLEENNEYPKNLIPDELVKFIVAFRTQPVLDDVGGYPIHGSVALQISKRKTIYVTAYGASEDNEGEDALMGLIISIARKEPL